MAKPLPCPSRSGLSRARLLLFGLAALGCALLCAPAARAEDLPLQLEISLNGANIGLISEIVSRDGALYAKPSELDQIGLLVPPDVKPEDGLIPLAALPGVTLKFNPRTQTLSITATQAALRPAQIGANARGSGLPLTPAGFGAVVDYDLTGTAVSGQNIGAGLLDTRVFGLFGIFDTTGVGYSLPSSGQTSYVRLDTQWTYPDPDTLRRYSVGDIINGGLNWTRPIRMGGLQVRTDFGLQPGLVTFALPTVTGQAALPSTADVLVNGVRQFSQQVTPGPFQLRQPPTVTGAGTIDVAVQDALGHQTITSLPFYVSPDLLETGRAAYSFEGGEARRDYGYQSDVYQDGLGSGTFRYGVTNWLTLESHAEGMGRLQMGGVSAAIRVLTLGVLSVAVAHSGGQGNGNFVSVGFQRQAAPFSFGVSASKATDGFRDLAALTGAPIVRDSYHANVGLSLGRYGSFAAAYVQQTGIASTVSLPTPATIGTVLLPITPSFQVITASYTNQINSQLSVIATAFGSIAGSRSFGAEIGLTYSFGPRTSGYAGITGDNSTGLSGVAQIQRSASQVGDFGYNLLDQEGGFGRRLAQVDYVSPFGRATAGFDSAPGYTAGRAEFRGALATLGGGVFATNYIDDSFAVVRSGDVPHIGVLYENRAMGQTGSNDRLLVPGLRAWESNTIALDPADMPLDVQAGSMLALVRPPEKSGVVVRFDLTRGKAAIVILVDGAGKLLPVGASVVANGGAPTVVGYDGETYLQDLQPDNDIAVTLPGPSLCHASFKFAPEAGAIPRIGPLACQ
jgi:outer membrane usher protein